MALEVDVVCAGLPCQGLSTANPRTAQDGYVDERNDAYLDFLEVLRRNPKPETRLLDPSPLTPP